MASSNAPPTVEKQEILTDDHKLALDKEMAELANSNVPSTVEEQEVKMDDPKLALHKQKIIGTAIGEMEHRVELFNKLTHNCFNKCVEKRYKEGDLNLGENSCIDRCVSKYWQVNNMIGHILAYGRRGV
ncbi:mitochondrial import inner membrane translocase subunit TIM10-like isoform X2 [Chenopodium quinoa]|uniref:mitochondrial import inner membrane translocase subunit TIM10-like isoform X2 n=1 Tax=Chenopodium quinoa TaxID=63459 RepID=UPI000B7725DE|nr:mitochondrial import inner membrane translocase subunit TIM10-like isoform X2 [Chenopodium quinoa]